MTTARKYVPSPDGLDLVFFQKAVETGVLHLQRCQGCGVFRHPPLLYCPECGSRNSEFVPSTQRGVVYSFTITHQAFEAAWVDETPYVTVVVELEEGPRVIGAARGIKPDAIQLGQPVAIEVDRRSEDFAFIWVVPAT